MAPLLTESSLADTARPGAAPPVEDSTPVAASLPPAASGPACSSCDAPMSAGQDWCLQCGAGAPGSVGGSGLGPLVTLIAVTALLVLGAGAAAFAALSRTRPHAPLVTTTVAQLTPAPATPAPVTPVSPPGALTPGTTPTVGGLVKPPKIPLRALTPTPAARTPTPLPRTPASPTPAPIKPKGGKEGAGGASTEAAPEPLLLDTNAASTYNPSGYPAADFGDPSLTIDGDPSTGWTAQLMPATAPHLAEGVVIDLHTAQRVSSLKLITTTPGMTVQVFGANGPAAPSSITAPAWAALSRSIVVRKRHARIGLRNRSKSYRFIVLWISRAPASALGTPQGPGRVTVNELELFPSSAG